MLRSASSFAQSEHSHVHDNTSRLEIVTTSVVPIQALCSDVLKHVQDSFAALRYDLLLAICMINACESSWQEGSMRGHTRHDGRTPQSVG